nr:CPPV009 C-type lectin-like protein [Cooks petrelpox virus]
MALNLSIRPIERELGIKVLAAALDPLNSENDHTGDCSFIAKVTRNVEFYRPRYLLVSAGYTVKKSTFSKEKEVLLMTMMILNT